MRRPVSPSAPSPVSRRGFLIGAAAAGGLAIGWTFWPRQAATSLSAAPGETIFNAFLKIGSDGHVTVVPPTVELGQGSATVIAQIIAEELGADWRTIAIEAAAVNSVYANSVVSDAWSVSRWSSTELQVTGESSTLRGFEMLVRRGAAAARILLCKAAGKRWDASWEACDTADGFVILGSNRLRFADLAADAVGFDLPDEVPLRSRRTLASRGMNRLDLPAKLDGSVTYAGDIRLPDMVFASITQGPLGDSRLLSVDKAAAERVRGVLAVVETGHWVACVGETWWSANRGLGALNARFETAGSFPSSTTATSALAKALEGDGSRIAKQGDVDSLLSGPKLLEHVYSAGFAAHAALEPMTATAELSGGKLQLWIATQAPDHARAAAARASGLTESDVVVHAMQVGGSFGRKLEIEVAAQAATLAVRLKRPVQLVWSRAEDSRQDRFRPAAQARCTGKLGVGGQIEAMRLSIATCDPIPELLSRMKGERAVSAMAEQGNDATLRAVSGAAPPYSLAAWAVDHHPVSLGVPTGKLRGGADGFTCFFRESFVDELSRAGGLDPFSIRMGMLTGDSRLALCLSKVATRGGWEGGVQGGGQGFACHRMQGSRIAVMAEAKLGDDQRVKVSKLVAVADIGRIMNPDIARQQIEGGLLYGMGLATGSPVRIEKGIASPVRMGAMGLPLLADMPEISVELIRSNEEPGGLGELAVPPVAPAIANAIASASGVRLRTLPLSGAA